MNKRRWHWAIALMAALLTAAGAGLLASHLQAGSDALTVFGSDNRLLNGESPGLQNPPEPGAGSPLPLYAASPAADVSFQISGNVVEPFYPGVSHLLDLVFTNPQSTPITVTSVTVSVDPTTSSTGCNGTDNLEVNRQFAGAATVPANSSQSLSALGVDSSTWPLLNMPDLPVNQDACQGATISLQYAGQAIAGTAAVVSGPGAGAGIAGIPVTGLALLLPAAVMLVLGVVGILLWRSVKKASHGKAGGR